MKVLTRDGIEIVEGQTYYKVDFNIYALETMVASREWIAGWIKFALLVNPTYRSWTQENVFSTPEGAYVALSRRVEDRYRRDIEMIDKQFSRMKERSK